MTGRTSSPDDDTGWTIRPEDTCQDCLAESDDDLDAYLAAVVRNHRHQMRERAVQ